MAKIAKLAIQSNLPQLDRLFDYGIPDNLESDIQIGSRVKVQFGRSKNLLDAFVVGFADASEFEGRLSNIESVVGNRPPLDPNVFELCRELSDRTVSPLGEFLKLAVPTHMPRAFAAHSQSDSGQLQHLPNLASALSNEYIDSLRASDSRHFVLSEPRAIAIKTSTSSIEAPAWLATFVMGAAANLANSKSTLIIVPDYREHEIAIEVLTTLGLGNWLVNYSQDQPKSKQYLAFLRALDPGPKIIIGSRSAAFAPAKDLGSIFLFDEADRSYIDQSSPYLLTRDVVLVRQSIEKCSLVFASHSMSTDIRRLLDAGYLKNSTLSYPAPKVSVSEPGFRVDSHAFSAIKHGLLEGSVLVQVASLGSSTSLYCKSCDTPATCPSCHGPLWVDSQGKIKCRWCNGFALDHKCVCGSVEFTPGRAGATRTAAELGRAFPNARVIESTGDKRLVRIPAGKNLVIATSGAEPYVEGGYSAVILLDAKVVVSRQSLRATEESVRMWSNAIAKGAANCSSVLVGVSSDLGKLLSLWNHERIASLELQSRQELLLPPSVRLGSVTADQALITQIGEALSSQASVSLIGPAPVEGNGSTDLWRLIFKYPYSEGVELARFLKAQVSKISSGRTRVSSSGRTSRAITVKMNDVEVV